MIEGSWFSTVFGEEVYDIPVPVTVVLDGPWSEFQEEHRTLLNKILQSVGHSLESVRMIHQNPLDISTWQEKPSRIIAFVPPAKGIALYEPIPIASTIILFSEPIQILAGDNASKRKLWEALRSLFAA